MSDSELKKAFVKALQSCETEYSQLARTVILAEQEPRTNEQCACVHPDKYMCIAIRTDRSYEEVMQAYDECQCYCHDGEEDEGE